MLKYEKPKMIDLQHKDYQKAFGAATCAAPGNKATSICGPTGDEVKGGT